MSQPDQQKMATSHCHEQQVTASFVFSSLKLGKLTFTQRPLSTHADLWLLPDAPITSECTELWSLSLSELPYSKEGEPPGQPLGILCDLCGWHCLPHPTMHWVQESPVVLTSPLDAPSSRPHIQSSTFQVKAMDKTALPQPLGVPRCPGLHLLLHDCFCYSSMGFCTVFTVISTCAVLQAQLTGPVQLISISLALV